MKRKDIEYDIGTIEISKVAEYDVSREYLYNYIKDNNYERISSGLYIAPGNFVDELYVLHKRCPNGVISHNEALFYYGLIDREPDQHTITIYSGYNATRLKKSGYKIYYVNRELLDLGKQTITDYLGNEIPMYDLERTIVDLIRNRSNFEIQDFTTALKSYVKRADKNLINLSIYAKAFHVDQIVRKYLEVLL